jgi:hypothetical protein
LDEPLKSEVDDLFYLKMKSRTRIYGGIGLLDINYFDASPYTGLCVDGVLSPSSYTEPGDSDLY